MGSKFGREEFIQQSNDSVQEVSNCSDSVSNNIRNNIRNNAPPSSSSIPASTIMGKTNTPQSAAWDENEAEDEMLSYFLGLDQSASPQTLQHYGGQVGQGGQAHSNKATAKANPDTAAMHHHIGTITEHVDQDRHEHEHDHDIPPPTPATHYYHTNSNAKSMGVSSAFKQSATGRSPSNPIMYHNPHHHPRVSTASTTSTTNATRQQTTSPPHITMPQPMTGPIIPTAPPYFHQRQQHQPHPQQQQHSTITRNTPPKYEDLSPISPAAYPALETLMLPTSPRTAQPATQLAPAIAAPKQHTVDQSHTTTFPRNDDGNASSQQWVHFGGQYDTANQIPAIATSASQANLYAISMPTPSNITSNGVHMGNPGNVNYSQTNATAVPPTYQAPTGNSYMPSSTPASAAAPHVVERAFSHPQHPFLYMPRHQVAAAAAAALSQMHHRAAASLVASASVVESEEKKAKRLERNRESARKSRRRKKERLSTLEQKVNKLYQQVEVERRKKIATMNAALSEIYDQTFRTIKEADASNTANVALKNVTRSTSPALDRAVSKMQAAGLNCAVRRAVTDFQYNVLSRAILQTYQRWLLWLTLQPEPYFFAGKNEYAKKEGGKQSEDSSQTAKTAPIISATNQSSKVSSKQIGDEFTNGPKTVRPVGVKLKRAAKEDDGEKAGQTANVLDAARMWPLACFELTISVDQEERILQTNKRIQQMETIDDDRSQIAAVVRMVNSLKQAVLYQSYLGSIRAKRSFVEILDSEQTFQYKKWLAENQTRCKAKVEARRQDLTEVTTFSSINTNSGTNRRGGENCDLLEVSRQLERVLQISRESHSTVATTVSTTTMDIDK